MSKKEAKKLINMDETDYEKEMNNGLNEEINKSLEEEEENSNFQTPEVYSEAT